MDDPDEGSLAPAPDWRQGLLEPAFRQAFNSIVITDADFSGDGPHIIAANPAFCAMTGYAEDELIGRSPRILQGPDTDPHVIARLSRAIRDGEFFLGRTVNYRKDGSPYTVEWNISPVREHGQVVAFVSIQHDISPQLAAERERVLFNAVGNLLPVPLLITDAKHRITFANARLLEVTGYEEAELVGRLPSLLYQDDLRDEQFAADVLALARGHELSRRLALRAKDGATVHVDQRVIPVSYDSDRGVMHLATFTDVSDLVVSVARWRSLANVDDLTGVLNRRGGEAALAAALREATQQESPLAVMVCDIDHFKRVNDTFGHPAGDRILSQVAQALQRTLRDRDDVARFGGEEFLVIARGVDAAAAQRLAERLRERIAALIDAEVGSVTVSIGVALLNPEQDDAEALLHRADVALYRAKQEGRNRVVVAAAS